jgi:ATP-binding cassette subfamily F protein 3
LKQQEAQEKEVAHLQQFIDKNKVRASTAKMAQSRMKKLEKMEMVVVNLPKDPTYNFTIPEPDLLQQPIFTIQDLAFGYEKNRILYTGVNVSIAMNSRAALVGANGVGKSTFLKLVMGQLEPISGQVKLNPKATIARFTQHHQDQLDMKLSPLDWFKDMYPTAKPQDIRKHLGRFGVSGNLALQPIYSLSGGQKSRVAFAHVTWKKPHLLLLDEPTNHLDMETIDCLIRALNNFTGGVLIVSHDAHLISTVCDEIWVCENRQIRVFNGDFDDYRKMLSIQQHNTMSAPKKTT